MTLSIPPLAPTRSKDAVAPTQAEWDRMTSAEREAAVASLPTWVDIEECGAVEGEEHQDARWIIGGTLRPHFAETDPLMYVSGEMGVFFPGERRVIPDLFAVPGAGTAKRVSWIVTKEGRRPQWFLEITVHGERDKDLRDHVVRYAELGVREYFIADLLRRKILAYRLNDPLVRIYTPVLAQGGRYRSEVLGLDVALEDGKVRFYDGDRRLLDPDERVEALRDALNDELMLRQDAEERAADEERARHDAEQARRDAEQARRDAEQARRDAEQARHDAERRATDEERARHDAEQRAADAAAELARVRELIERLQRG
jgi:Uma2 family endonuclease